MDIRKISSFLSVSPQIYSSEVEQLAALGFKTIFNNRPDNEVTEQPLGAEIAAEAANHGLIYVDLPIITYGITAQNVADFGIEIMRARGPVLAYCRSGTRSTTLWARYEARRVDADAIISFAATIGYDLSKHRDQFVQAYGKG